MKTEKNPKGAGPKFKFGEPTKNVTFRLPLSQIPRLKVLINDLISKFHVK